MLKEENAETDDAGSDEPDDSGGGDGAFRGIGIAVLEVDSGLPADGDGDSARGERNEDAEDGKDNLIDTHALGTDDVGEINSVDKADDAGDDGEDENIGSAVKNGFFDSGFLLSYFIEYYMGRACEIYQGMKISEKGRTAEMWLFSRIFSGVVPNFFAMESAVSKGLTR